MPSQLPLDMLINLAKESTDEAARLLGGTAAAQTTSLTAPGVPYTQTFDTLDYLSEAGSRPVKQMERPRAVPATAHAAAAKA